MKSSFLMIVLIILLSLIVGIGILLLIQQLKSNPAQQTEYPNKIITRAWLPWWDFENAQKEVEQYGPFFNQLVPLIFILNKDGQIEAKIQDVNQRLTQLKNFSNAQIIVSIYNDFDGDRVSKIINQPTARARHIEQLVGLVSSDQISGLELDYEYLKAEDKDSYSLFVKELAAKLHQIGKTLHLTLHPKTNSQGDWHGATAQDWQVLSKHADYLVVMAYDYHWQTSPSGPIAPLPWVSQVISYAKKEMPSQKIILGVPLYAYDWTESKQKAKDLTLKDLDRLSQEFSLTVSKDNHNQSVNLIYQDQDNRKHQIWTEDEDSFQAKLNLVKDQALAGFSIWRLGGVPASYFKKL
ncbi:hypothetical protein HYS93_04830 [Candidatus Daviesbacteria bacterium]|nr:hypothetical protein [Candidatus Daviesbacteria bacterium]